jgi:hypothetical protein
MQGSGCISIVEATPVMESSAMTAVVVVEEARGQALEASRIFVGVKDTE